MKKIIFLLFLIFLNLYAFPDVYPETQTVFQGEIWKTTGWNGNNTNDLRGGQCGLGIFMDGSYYVVNHDFGNTGNGDPTQCYHSYSYWYDTHETPATSCSWAVTPPWYSTTRTQSTCNNFQPASDSSINTQFDYFFNFSWCSADSTCYAKRYYCPAGQTYDSTQHACVAPKKPDPSPRCPSGWYPTAIKHIATINGSDMCGQDWICKNDPTLIINREFSCGSGPVDGPADPTTPNPPDPSAPSAQPYKDGTSACTAKRDLAKLLCASPNIFTFTCDPLTGTPLTSTCTPPTLPTPNDPTSGDSSTGATTADIKNLGNSLPAAIRDSIKDYFMDGSSPYLSEIKGTLDQTNFSLAAANDTLDNIDNSLSASLGKQDATNFKLDAIKTAIDGVNTSSGNYGTYLGDSMPSSSDLAADADHSIKGTLDSLVSDVSNIGSQFTDLKNMVSGNFTPPDFNDGTMPVFSADFHGTPITVDTNKITDLLTPYSPLIAILTYISLMFLTFRSVFNFLSRGI
jgi:hypothetical protein